MIVQMLYLLLVPTAAGSLLKLNAKKEKRTFQRVYLSGTVFLLALFEIVFLIFSRLGRGLLQLAAAWGVLSLLLLAGGVAVPAVKKKGLGEIAKTVFANGADDSELSFRSLLIPAVCFAVSAAFMFTVGLPVSQNYYSDAEKTVSVLNTGTFFGIDPLTGLWTNDLTTDDQVISMPSFYAVLAKLMGMGRPYGLLRIVVPCWVLFCIYLILSELSGIFFARSVYLYPVFTLLLLCAGRAYRNPFYDLLHVGWEGRSIMAFIVLPAAFLMLCDMAGGSKRDKDAEGTKPSVTGSVKYLIGAAVLLLASVGAAGIGSGAVLLLSELLVGVICLIFMYFQKRFTT